MIRFLGGRQAFCRGERRRSDARREDQRAQKMFENMKHLQVSLEPPDGCCTYELVEGRCVGPKVRPEDVHSQPPVRITLPTMSVSCDVVSSRVLASRGKDVS